MPELYADTGRLAHVGSYHLYVMHDGRLVLSSSYIKLVVTPEQAREILDMLLVLARYFSGESQPARVTGTEPLLEVSSNGNKERRQ